MYNNFEFFGDDKVDDDQVLLKKINEKAFIKALFVQLVYGEFL